MSIAYVNLEAECSKLLRGIKCTMYTTLTGLEALALHGAGEKEKAVFLCEWIPTAAKKIIENKISGWRYRVSILKSITNVSVPNSYNFGPVGQRKGSRIDIPFGNTNICSTQGKKDLVDIMTDIDVNAWLQAIGWMSNEGKLVNSKCKKRKQEWFNKDAFARGQRGLWKTAVENFVKELRSIKTSIKTSEFCTFKAPEQQSVTIPQHKIPASDYDVNTPTPPASDDDDDAHMLENSISEPCYMCTENGLDFVLGQTSILCCALQCCTTICDVCLKRQLGHASPTSLDDYKYYCNKCAPLLETWQLGKLAANLLHLHSPQLMTEAELMTEEQATTLRKEPMNMSTNSEANVWNFYIQNFLQQATFLPPSMHPKLAEQNSFFNSLHTHYPQIVLMGSTALKKDRRRASEQFKKINHLGVSYVNSPVAIELTSLYKDYDRSTVYSWRDLSLPQQKIMTYIMEREDNHSALTLARNEDDSSMYAVLAKTFIPKGCSPLEYGGVHYLGGQMTTNSIAGADSSITWTVADNNIESKAVYLQPLLASNYGRFINAVRTVDMRKANLAIMKVTDSKGNIHLRFIATRDIEAGEQLLYWYGDRYDDSDFVSLEKFLHWKEL